MVPGEPLIAFKDVHIGFDEHEVLSGISFEVWPGETKVLLGESGSGKTLIMKLAAGLLDARCRPYLGDGPRYRRDVRRGTARFPAAFGIRFPGRRAVRFHDGGGERGVPAARRKRRRRRKSMDTSARPCGSSKWRIRLKNIRRSFPAECGAAFRSPARWWIARRLSSTIRPPLASTRSLRKPSSL